jgi:hypothetical protein
MAANNLPLRELELVHLKMVSTISGPEMPPGKGGAFRQDLRGIIASTDEIFENLDHSDTEMLLGDELIDHDEQTRGGKHVDELGEAADFA